MITLHTQTKLPQHAILDYIFAPIWVYLRTFIILVVVFGGVGYFVTAQLPAGVKSPFDFSLIIVMFGALFGALALYGAIRGALFCKLLTFVVDDMSVTISAGIIARNQRTVQFDEVQNVGVSQSVLQRMLGLGTLYAYTSSPGQMQVIGSRNSVHTIYRPDISLVLLPEDAEQLRSKISAAIKRVEVTALPVQA